MHRILRMQMIIPAMIWQLRIIVVLCLISATITGRKTKILFRQYVMVLTGRQLLMQCFWGRECRPMVHCREISTMMRMWNIMIIIRKRQKRFLRMRDVPWTMMVSTREMEKKSALWSASCPENRIELILHRQRHSSCRRSASIVR